MTDQQPRLPLRCEMPSQQDKPGSYNFFVAYGDPEDEPPRGMHFICPCGCGSHSSLQFRGREIPGNPGRPSWEWDGNRSHPTLKPSIQRNTECNWHGFLTRGYWVFNPDDAPALSQDPSPQDNK